MSEKAAPPQSFATKGRAKEIELDRRVAELKLQILEALAAGFYSYGAEKKYQYLAARAMMGGILELLYSYREQSPKLRQTLQFLEEACIPPWPVYQENWTV